MPDMSGSGSDSGVGAPVCRICLCGGEVHSRCECGEASWFHDACLRKWIRERGPKCEICGCFYHGLRMRSYTRNYQPNQMDILTLECSGAAVLMYSLWWLNLLSREMAMCVLWWIMCTVQGRARVRRGRLRPTWRIHAVTYRLLSTGSSRN